MKKLLIAVFALLIAGCATPYKANGIAGGYSDLQIDQNVFRVSFRGNGYTSAQRVQEMTLMRSAELSLEHGFAYFVVVDSNDSARHGAFSTPTYATTTSTAYGNTATAHTVMTGGQIFQVTFPSSSNTIVCYKDRPAGVIVFDARMVFDSLAAKYKR